MLGNSDKVKAGCRVLTGGENDAAAATTTAPAPPSLPLPLKRSLNQYDHGHGHGHGHDLHQVTGLGLQDEGVDGGQGQDYQHRLQPQTSKKQRLMTTETTVMMHHYHHHHEEGEGEGGEELPVAMSIMSTLTSSSAPVDALNATEETLTTTTVTPVVEKEKDEGEISQIPSSSLSPLDTVRNVLHAQLLENTSPSSAEEREGDVLTAPRMQVLYSIHFDSNSPTLIPYSFTQSLH